MALAQIVTPPVPAKSAASAPKTASSAALKASNAKAAWAKLTSKQQEALQPLAPIWHTMSEAQQRKWLEVSKNYPNLPGEDQARMHSRAGEWAALSSRQRTEARLNFGITTELSKELTPEEKRAKWQAYQALTAEEKKKLASEASRKPTGAAPAARPVAAQKLATLPGPAGTSSQPARVATESPARGVPAQPAVPPGPAPGAESGATLLPAKP
ncbi:MAG: DUF3106 domain-containing protein [Pseudomonadota bacterium]